MASELPAVSEDCLEGTAYRYVSTLGRGGMGIVVEARHLELGRKVAIKLLHQEDVAWSARLRSEASVLAQLSSPHLVTVFDIGTTAAGTVYVVMERLFGHSLGTELRKKGPLAAQRAVRFAREALLGVAQAHAAGIVHRDLKPENLFVCKSPAAHDQVKVLDFGIAKWLSGSPAHAPTGDGTILGSPRYMSPEQAAALAVDGRSDVYSMGATLFAMLVGRAPFDHLEHGRASFDELCRAHRSQSPPRLSSLLEVPPALDRIVAKALSKRPEDRFPTAAHFEAALSEVALSELALGNADKSPRACEALPWTRVRSASLPAPKPPQMAAPSMQAGKPTQGQPHALANWLAPHNQRTSLGHRLASFGAGVVMALIPSLVVALIAAYWLEYR